jgi:phenylacetate-CoA ligase
VDAGRGSEASRPGDMSGWPPQPPVRPISASQPYWAAEETMAPQRRAKIVLEHLRGQMRYAWDRSPFYRRLWGKAGVSPESLRTLGDLVRFPIVTKERLRQDQDEHPPFGSNICCDASEIGRIHGSSGTTGRSTMFVFSGDDWARVGAAHARIMWSFGVRPGDGIFIGSFFSLYLGSWGALAGAKTLGCRLFPFGAGVPGQTERAIELLQLVRPQVFYATPSYALHLAKIARSKDVDPARLGFRIMFFSGEPGAGIPATKRRIEATFDAACIDTGSMAEMTPWMTNAECDERAGMHLWDDIVYTEIVDPETHEPIDGDGEGVLVYTHLGRTSQPMIRLFSSDLTRVTSEPCACGRTYRRLPEGIYGRVDDMLIIRGVNVYPHSIEDAIASVPGVGSEYRIVIERPEELDVLRLEIEASSALAGNAVRDAVRLKTGLAPIVTVLPLNTLETTEFKSRRIEDCRPSAASQLLPAR